MNDQQDFWVKLPFIDDDDPGPGLAAIAALPPKVIAQLCGYWLGMFQLAGVARDADTLTPDPRGRRLTDVRARATRAVRILAIAAEKRGLDSTPIRNAHMEALEHLRDGRPLSEVYNAGADAVKRLQLRVSIENASPPQPETEPPPPPAKPEPLIPVVEASEAAGVSDDTVRRRLKAAGFEPLEKVNGKNAATIEQYRRALLAPKDEPLFKRIQRHYAAE